MLASGLNRSEHRKRWAAAILAVGFALWGAPGPVLADDPAVGTAASSDPLAGEPWAPIDNVIAGESSLEAEVAALAAVQAVEGTGGAGMVDTLLVNEGIVDEMQVPTGETIVIPEIEEAGDIIASVIALVEDHGWTAGLEALASEGIRGEVPEDPSDPSPGLMAEMETLFAQEMGVLYGTDWAMLLDTALAAMGQMEGGGTAGGSSTTTSTGGGTTVNFDGTQGSLDAVNAALQSAAENFIAEHVYFRPRFNGRLAGGWRRIRRAMPGPPVALDVANSVAFQTGMQMIQPFITDMMGQLQNNAAAVQGPVTIAVSDHIFWLTTQVNAAGGHYNISIGLGLTPSPGIFRPLAGQNQPNPPNPTAYYCLKVSAHQVGRVEGDPARPGLSGALGTNYWSNVNDFTNFLSNELRTRLMDITQQAVFGPLSQDDWDRLVAPYFGHDYR